MKKLTIFLSHSSRDKAFVRRLSSDLKAHGFDTWFDEERIPLGGSITEEIELGLEKSDVTLLFLSEYALQSKWVMNEWQSRFFEQMRLNRIMVIPVRLDKCEIPALLKDKRRLDFIEDKYEEGLSILLANLSVIKQQKSGDADIFLAKPSKGILSITRDLLDDLESEYISLPSHRRLDIIDTLKKLPRSGKLVRLETFKPRLKIRSVYDHIISLAHISDCLFDEIEHGIPATDVAKVAFCIAYHELNEVVLGDIPTYTSLNADRRNLARIFAEQKLRMVQPTARKQIANDFIWMFLSDKHRNAFKSTFKILSDESDPVYLFFRALDKIDPVVAVWRYLHHYRGRLGNDPKDFNRHMKDFYENPDVRLFVEVNKMDGRLIDFVLNLQDRAKAWDYYQDRSKVFGDENLFQLPREIVCKTIEGVALFEDNKGDDFPKRAPGRNVSRDAFFRSEAIRKKRAQKG